jgi:CTP synthase
MFEDQHFSELVLKKFDLEVKTNNLSRWYSFTEKAESISKEVKIGVIGKYFSTGDFTLSDAYISVLEAIKHAGVKENVKPQIYWLNSEEYENDPDKINELRDYDGILIPGGFGSRGIEGKIKAIEFCRVNKIPYLGLCYGMQCAVIEFARNELGWKDANTTEIDTGTSHAVIHTMEDQINKIAEGDMGGTMRLGSYPCKLKEGTFSQAAYKTTQISERHRHRYEFNNLYRADLESAGLIIAGASPDDRLVEIVEVKDHPFFVGVQFHPEFQSRPLSPHPLFVNFIKAAKDNN